MRDIDNALTQQGRDLYQRADALWNAQAEAFAELIPAADAHASARALDSMLRHLLTATPTPSEIES